jgi:hypothetical protein
MHNPASAHPAPPEGLAFDIGDLQTAMAWVATQPGVQLRVATDHHFVQEALEICLPGKTVPRWFIWRDYQGRLHFDDWLKSEFGLPCQTLAAALAFIKMHF